jgi:4-amino-4-deoxy-L-arabinose transferase-like glycosyltransferase
VKRPGRPAALAALLAAALALRLLHLFEVWRGPFSPRFYLPIDAREYHFSALAWLRGAWPPPEPFFRPPLYTFFLGSVYAVTGPHPVAVLALQALLGTATCALAWAVAAELFRDRAVPPLAAALCAASGTLIYFDAQLLSASLDVFLLLLALWLLLVAARRDSLPAVGAAGLALGLSIANRGSGLLLVPLLVAWIALGAGSPADARAASRRAVALARSLALLAPVLLVLAPIALHNARHDEGGGEPLPARETLRRLASGRFVLLAANSGINLYLGNHPGLREVNRIDHPDHIAAYDRIRTEPLRRGIRSHSAANAELARATFYEIRRAPGAWLRLAATKVAELFDGAEIPRNANLYADREHSVVLAALLWKRGVAFPSGVLIPFGLVGIALALRDARRHALPMGALAIQGAFVVAFFVTDRYRLPMLPLFAIYAASALVEIARRARAGGARAAAAPAGAAALLLVACNAGLVPVSSARGYAEYHNLGVAHVERGDLGGAEDAFGRALGLNPDHVDALVALCKVRLDLSRAGEARESCERAVALRPDSALLRQQLGLVLEALGALPAAALQYRRALELEPGAPVAKRALERLRAAGSPGEP